MSNYNTGLLTKQERCRHFIIRQLEVSGREVTEEEVNDMVATGKWEVFNENMLNDAKITRSQLSEIEQRHKARTVFLITFTHLVVEDAVSTI
jgi:syntaxin 11